MPTNYLEQQAEKINSIIPKWFNNLQGPLMPRVKRTQKFSMGERDFRIPFQQRPVGRFGEYDPHGGTIGRGQGASYSKGIGRYHNFRFCVELTELETRVTSDKSISQKNALKDALKEGVPEFAAHLDQAYHGDGTPVIGTAIAHAVVGGVSVYTLDTNTGLKYIRRGQPVIPYLADMSAQRAGGSAIVTKIDRNTRQITLDRSVTSAGATDKFTWEGVSGANPLGPWGTRYFNSTALTGTTYGIDRAAEPDIVPTFLASVGVPTVLKCLQIRHMHYLNTKKDPKWVALTPVEQLANIWSQVLDLTVINHDRTKPTSDLFPDAASMKFRWGNVDMVGDFNQPADIIDFIDFSGLIRVQLPGGDVQFWTSPGSDQKFFNVVGADGTPTARTWFAWRCNENIIHMEPRNNAAMTGLTPSQY